MKREILFRGQRSDKKQWVEGDLIHGVGLRKGKMYILPLHANLASLEGCDPLDGYSVIPETIGQFTGLTDKNGTKIFEGDIVKTKIERMEFTTTVVWGEKSKGWSIKCDRTGREKWGKIKYYSLPFSHNIEVAGNLFDNSELLK